MKHLHRCLGIICAFCLMIILFITSIEAVCYWNPGYFKKEYEKHQVLNSLPEMSMEDLLTVTDEMMDYLKGGREDLHVWTTMGGEYREFFTPREIAHMEDVRGLFLAAVSLRRIMAAVLAGGILLLVFIKARLRTVLPKSFLIGAPLFLVIAALLSLIIASDFSRYFVLFHHLFFTNDLWILDPAVDMLVNIVPEPFFMDTAARIAGTFCSLVVLVFLLSFGLWKKQGRAVKGLAGLTIFLCFFGLPAHPVRAAQWPQCREIQADGGILIDGDSGTVLYEKNADQAYFPASITKVLTALIIIENCDMDEMVTFSYNAVHNVERGSSNMGTLDGDQLTVRDCLYGLMLASANEAGNALAEHYAGSIEAFSEIMNEKARELGCTGSNFANPSGLNNPDHYTTARDMALIMQAAMQNPDFVEIDSALYWRHAPIKRYPDPDDPNNVVYAHHAMLKKNDSRYYPGIIAGKTGYTSLAGNTLVTSASRDGLNLICVILNGRQTHYQDTKTLFDFGFSQFQSINVAENGALFSALEDDLTFGQLSVSPKSSLVMAPDCYITLPKDADFHDTVSTLNYQLPRDAPPSAIAGISYYYGDHLIGSSHLLLHEPAGVRGKSAASPQLTIPETITIPEPTTKPLEEIAPEEASTLSDYVNETTGETADAASKKQKNQNTFTIPSSILAAFSVTILLAALIGGIIFFKLQMQKRELLDRALRQERRKRRLRDIGYSQKEFDLLVEKKKRKNKPDGGRTDNEKTKHDFID